MLELKKKTNNMEGVQYIFTGGRKRLSIFYAQGSS